MTEEAEFTVAQANQLLSALAEVLRQLRHEVGLAAERPNDLRSLGGHNGGGAWASAILAAGQRAARHVSYLESRGILLRDVEAGLVDFPSHRDGRPIFLCWRLGETEVGWWHPRDQGYISRLPL